MTSTAVPSKNMLYLKNTMAGRANTPTVLASCLSSSFTIGIPATGRRHYRNT